MPDKKNDDGLWLILGLLLIAAVFSPATAVAKSGYSVVGIIILVLALAVGAGFGLGYLVF